MGIVFYFVAQTGCITPHRLQTNFYSYTIPEIRKGEVLAEVERAELSTSGLVYPQEFLEDLVRWDKEGQRLLNG